MEQIFLIDQGSNKGCLVYGDAPRNKAQVKELVQNFDYIYNLKDTPKADWYFDIHLRDDPDFVPKRFVHMKTGFNSKMGVFKLANKICTQVSEKGRVYVHGKSFEDASTAVALAAQFMLMNEKDFDPIKFVRQKGYFNIAVERHIRELINFTKEKSVNTMFWFQQKQKKN